MTKQTITTHHKVSPKQTTNNPTLSRSPFTIKFALFMAFLVSFLLPVILFLPFIIAKLLGVSLIDKIGLSSDNFGVILLFTQVLGLIICVILAAKKLKQRRLSWSALGLKRFNAIQGIKYIVGYYLIVIGLLIALAVIVFSLGASIPPPPDNEAGGSKMLDAVGSFWLTFIITVIFAPVIEEIVFRGVLLPALAKRYGIAIGIISSSLIFTLVHINPIQMLSVLPLGIYLAIMYQRTGSIYPGMILHASWNLLVLLIAQSSI